ncbi:hypothetical protein PG999_008130 [Apiospora kogelbergensis]|uniref:Uncharacterized protein n=1 Tax=Apiospora kogelbergensis TaxID=1337665 RepID=A0AAW0QPS2_9PEZI
MAPSKIPTGSSSRISAYGGLGAVRCRGRVVGEGGLHAADEQVDCQDPEGRELEPQAFGKAGARDLGGTL